MSRPSRRLPARAAVLAAVAAVAALGVWIRIAPARLPADVAASYRTAAGEPLFYTPDAFYHLRLAREIAETGRRGERVDGRAWDYRSFAPSGRPVHPSLLQPLEAWLWKLWPGEASLAAVAFHLPVALSALSVLLAFWIGRRLAGVAAGLAAALLTAVHPELASHTHAGMADNAALHLVGLSLAAALGWALARRLWRRTATPHRRALLASAALAFGVAIAALFALSPAGRRLVHYAEPGWPEPFPAGALQVQELAALGPGETVDRLGGWTVLALAAAALLWLAWRAPRPAGPLGALLLAAWALPPIAAGSQAMRFLVYAVPALALAAGCALAAFAGAVLGWGRWGGRHGTAVRTALAVLAAFALAALWIQRLEGIAARRPAADLALAEAAAAIRAESPADALVYSWWDHGHALAALSGRGVVLDGASFQTPRLYWLALALTVHDETLATNVLRVIGCGGEDALWAAVAYDAPPEIAIDWLRRALRHADPDAAADYLLLAGADGEAAREIRDLLACRPPPSWLMVTGDLTAKTTSWSWFGTWRFDRPNRRPAPRMTAPVRCSLTPEGALECAGGFTADLASDGFEDRSTPGHFAATGPPSLVNSGERGELAPVLHQHGDELLLTRVRPWLVDSLFSRLYFFHGRGLEHFRLEEVFHHPPHTGRVLLYRIVWDSFERSEPASEQLTPPD